MKHFFLVLLTIVTVALMGCSVSDRDKTSGEQAPMGRTSVKLRSAAGDCVMGTIQILDSSSTVVSSFDTDCTDPSHEVILLPGDYTVAMAPGYTCDPAGDPPGYVECEFIESVPDPFTVVVNEVTDVALRFRFSYENTDDEMVLFSVGGGNVILDPPENEERCGTGPECAEGDICATVDGVGPDCYTICVLGGAACADGLSCIAVGALEDQGPNAPPNLCIIGTECDLETTFHLCLPGSSGVGGAGGMGGASGASGASGAGGAGAQAGAGGSTAQAGAGGTSQAGAGGSTAQAGAGGSVPPAEVCNGVDDNMDGIVDNGPGMECAQNQATICVTGCGTLGSATCSDTCMLGACTAPAEICNDGVDNDCDGDMDCDDADCAANLACTQCVDEDGDGFYGALDCGTAFDCNDEDASIHPGAEEVCNGVDDDCNTLTDDGIDCGTGGTGGTSGTGGSGGTITCVDLDGDGYSRTLGCGPLDCKDNNAAIHPNATEVCNGVDDDCDYVIDEGCVIGTGGTSGVGGAPGVGGTVGTGGTPAVGGASGTGGSGGDLIEVTFVFTGPETYGNLSTPYVGGGIYVNGYSPNLAPPWGTFCDPADDANPSPTDLTCTVYLTANVNYVVQVSMAVAGAPDGFIHFGDFSDTPNGGVGASLGLLEIYVDGVLTSFAWVEAPSNPTWDTWNELFHT